MREKIKGVAKLAAFVICLGLLIHWIDRTVVIKYMYDHSEPQTLTYEGFYNMKKESVDVLIMGTSQAAAGFNPQDLYNARQIRSYNLASSAQPVWLTYYWLKEALNYQKPSVVVFDCNYMFSDRIYEDSCRRALDYMRWGRTKTEAVRAVVEYDIYADENMLSYVFPFFRFHERWKEFDEWDFNWANFSGTPSPLKGFWYYDGHDQNTDYELFTDSPDDPDSAVFKEGHTYRCYVQVLIDEAGYAFANDGTKPTVKCYIDGKGATVGYGPNDDFRSDLWLYRDYEARIPEIDSVSVTGVTWPAPGEKPVYDAQMPAGATYELENFDNGSWYNGIYWEDMTDNETLDKDDVFRSGHTYRVTVSLVGKNGAVFTKDDVSAAVNGKEAWGSLP